ncbi:MAG: hypothetical protein ACRCWU_03095 [Metamycoplasmataceae bacterium]
MKKNMKKMALGVMTTGAFLVPLAVVSCGSSTNDDDEVGIALSVGGIKQTPLPMTMVDINNANIKTLATLERLFDMGSLTQEQIDEGLNVEFIRGDDNYYKGIVRLTSKEGYKMLLSNGKYHTELDSVVFTADTIITMHYQKKDNLEGQLTNEDMKNVNSIETLSKLFNGVQAKHLRWFNATHVRMSGGLNYVNLMAKAGYSFGNTTNIRSNTFTLS